MRLEENKESFFFGDINFHVICGTSTKKKPSNQHTYVMLHVNIIRKCIFMLIVFTYIYSRINQTNVNHLDVLQYKSKVIFDYKNSFW